MSRKAHDKFIHEIYCSMSVIQSLLELPDTLNNSLPVDELKLLDKTVTFFSQYQSFQLVNWSRKEGGPWDKQLTMDIIFMLRLTIL